MVDEDKCKYTWYSLGFISTACLLELILASPLPAVCFSSHITNRLSWQSSIHVCPEPGSIFFKKTLLFQITHLLLGPEREASDGH